MDFTKPWDFSDVTFIVEGRGIHVNKGTLAVSSEVFRAMFTTRGKAEKMTEILLLDEKFDDFLQLMQILHPLSDKGVDDTNVEGLLHLAHEYKILQVVERCEKVLVKQRPSIHNLILADKFSLTKLRQVFLRYIKDVPIDKFQNNPEFEKLDKVTQIEVLERHSMHQQLSTKNLFLAEKYKDSKVYEECVQYIKGTPLSKLKTESGFTRLDSLQKEPEIEPSNDARPGLVQHTSMIKEPSIKNLLLAEKYEDHEAYDKCMKYLKDMHFSELKAEDGFEELKPETIIEILTHKYEFLHTEVSNVISWQEIDEPEQEKCDNCRIYLGATMDCIDCKAYRFDVLADFMRTSPPSRITKPYSYGFDLSCLSEDEDDYYTPQP